MTARLSPNNLKVHNSKYLHDQPPQPPHGLKTSSKHSRRFFPASRNETEIPSPSPGLLSLFLARYSPSTRSQWNLNECLDYLERERERGQGRDNRRDEEKDIDFLPSIFCLMIYYLQKFHSRRIASAATASLLSISSRSDISTPGQGPSSLNDPLPNKYYFFLQPLLTIFPSMNYLGILSPSSSSSQRHYIILDSYLFECAQVESDYSLFPIGYRCLSGVNISYSSTPSFCVNLNFDLPSEQSLSLCPESSVEEDCLRLFHLFLHHSKIISPLPYRFEIETDGSMKKLGIGRYSEIYQATKVIPAKDSETEGRPIPIAVKVIDKKTFQQYVKEGSEKNCAVTREVISLWMLQWKHFLSLTMDNDIDIQEWYFEQTHVESGLNGYSFLKIFGIRETRTHFYVEMEKVSQNLLTTLTQSPENRLSEDHTRHIISQLIQAIISLQSCGMAHRDIKLSNIGILDSPVDDTTTPLSHCDRTSSTSSFTSSSPKKSKSFRSKIKKLISKSFRSKRSSCDASDTVWKSIKLLDFGMIGFTDHQNQLKGRCGSLGYIAPEILSENEKSYTMACDMFSIGVVMYMLLSGYEPFGGQTDEETKERNQKCLIDLSGKEWQNISLDCKLFLCGCLNSSPLMRLSPLEALNHQWMTGSSHSALPLFPQALYHPQSSHGPKSLPLPHTSDNCVVS